MERLARGGGVFTSLHQRMLSLLSTAIIAKAKVSAARDEPTVALSDADGLPDGLPSRYHGAQARGWDGESRILGGGSVGNIVGARARASHASARWSTLRLGYSAAHTL